MAKLTEQEKQERREARIEARKAAKEAARIEAEAGGIGASCYDKISEYIGGTWEHVASGKSFDCYKYTDLN